MKRMDIFCASQASTAICMSMDQPSSSSSSASTSNLLLGGRAIDRHNPIIRDPRRISSRALPLPPCTSEPPPINPKPYHLLRKSKKAAAKNKADNENKRSSEKSAERKHKKSSSIPNDKDEKSCAEVIDIGGRKSGTRPSEDDDNKRNSVVAKDIGERSWAKPADIITPPGSSRYLLSDTAFFDGLPDYDPVMELIPAETNRNLALIEDDSTASKPPASSLQSERPADQVVVLRVSLHCRGCEGKVRKHLSRMEGVTSYSIDFAAKKVTIVGDVTPLGVLASVSKVKNAQFWPAAQATTPNATSYNTGFLK